MPEWLSTSHPQCHCHRLKPSIPRPASTQSHSSCGGGQYTSSSLQSNINNWASFMSNEAQFGYTSLAPCTIDAAMYQRISDTDWRKLMWKAPAGTALDGKSTYIDAEYGASLPDYASLKFRPGSGEVADYKVGAAVAYPLMRIEEMYFIEAEAAAHQDAADRQTEAGELHALIPRPPNTHALSRQPTTLWRKSSSKSA